MTKKRINEIMGSDPQYGGKATVVFGNSLMILIWLNVIAVILSSVDEIYASYNKIFIWFEYISITVFAVEYILRLWTAPSKLRYIFSFMGMVDLLTILPFFMPFIANIDSRIFRILRIFRIVRVLKLFRYNKALDLITRVFREHKEKLFITIFFMGIMLLLASSFMYFIENRAQPDKFPSIPATLWWAVATITTVGYGDVYPLTNIGKILGAVIAVMGVGLIALPTGIISMGLIKAVETKVPKRKRPGKKPRKHPRRRG